jgi:cytochrome P450
MRQDHISGNVHLALTRRYVTRITKAILRTRSAIHLGLRGPYENYFPENYIRGFPYVISLCYFPPMELSTSPPNAAVPDFPMTRGCPFAPPPRYAELRESEPISRATLPGGQQAWLITRHDLVRQILADHRLSSDVTRPNYPMTLVIPRQLLIQQQRMGAALINADPPEHTDRRKMVLNELTARRMKELRPRIQEIVDEHIDAMLAGPQPADLVTAIGSPVASMVISELLGVPTDQRDFFLDRTKVLTHHSTSPQGRAQAGQELGEYFDRLVKSKQEDDSDDLLGRLVRRNEETGVFTHELLVGITQQLLLAGYETTANMISLGTLALLEHPDQLAAMIADPALVPGAVEELLRYLTIVTAVYRVTTEDIEIGGMTIKAGEGVIPVAGAANWDPDKFEAPDELRIDRPRPQHMAFGYGIHQCIGHNLARVELEVVYGTLFKRVPTLRSAVPLEDLSFKKDLPFYGLWEFPVTW